MDRYSNRIDWLSFVLPTSSRAGQDIYATAAEALEASMAHTWGEAFCTDLFSNLQPLAFGRAPYAQGYQDRARGITVWTDDRREDCCVEISGQGCGYLYQMGTIDFCLRSAAEFLSRIDVAIDLETDDTPEQFVEDREGGRARTHSHMMSDKGTTIYVGSMHSEHYCRVYRYNSPHPRAHLLRVEFVARRKRAKVVGAQILLNGLESVSRTLFMESGFPDDMESWKHVEPSDLSTLRPERNVGGTTRWLITQAAPAFQRLVREGIITNPDQFLESYFMSALWEDGTISLDKTE